MYSQCLLFSVPPPPLLPPPQITITFSQITARAIFYSADVRLWHLIPLGLSGEGKGSLQSPGLLSGLCVLELPRRAQSRRRARSSKRGAQGTGATLGVKSGPWQRVLSRNKSAQPCKNSAAQICALWAAQGGSWHSEAGVEHLNPLPSPSWPSTPKARVCWRTGTAAGGWIKAP